MVCYRMRKGLRVVLVDLGGTLMVEEESSEELSKGIAEELGLRPAPSYSRVYRGYGLRFASLCEASLEAVAYYYAARSDEGRVDPGRARRVYKDLVEALARSLRPLPGARETLRELSGLVDRVVVVSNASSQEAVEEALRMQGFMEYVDAVVTSRLVGVRKPDPRIFLYALGLVGARPDEAVHIGDRGYEDIFGAKNLGIRAIHIARDEPPSPIADAVIASVEEAPEAVTRLVEEKD